MTRTHSTLTIAFVLVATATTALADAAWTLDDSLRTLSTAQRDALIKGVSKAPENALKAILDEEVGAVEKLHKDEVSDFAKSAWARIRSGRKDGHLWRAIKAELKGAGVTSEDLLGRVVAEERARLDTIPERAVFQLVDRVFKAAVFDRIQALKKARIEAAHVTGAWGDAQPADIALGQPNRDEVWRETRGDAAAADVNLRSSLPLPKVKFFTEEFKLEETLYERTFNTELGNLKVTAAKVEGLANARAGRVTYTNEFGQVVEGLGATFTARAKVTGARGDFTSKDITAAATDMRIRSRVVAMAEAVGAVEASSTTVVNELGFGTHNVVRAGAGVRADLRIPVAIDLKLFKIHVIPYVSAHAGTSAEAHATFEVEWTGTLRLDLGAHVSSGLGAGAGLIVQIELGETLRRALDRLAAHLAKYVRPVADGLMGRSWKGPASNSDKLTLSLADLERLWAERGELTRAPVLDDAAAIAARYAPVLHQRVTRGPFDYLRRVDFDGDWNTENNWNHTSPEADSSAWVYYDVRETETHYYVTYVLYHSGRKSNALVKPLRLMRRHENDMGGVTVVARKGASRGREVEVVMTHNGDRTITYSGLEKRDGDKTRWSTRHGHWSGPVSFVDEADHPRFDMERTHPQVWVDGKDHDVYGFTGRDDTDPFSGEAGVTYVYTGAADRPEGDRDPQVGYALRPLDELRDRVGDEQTFSPDERVRAEGGAAALPTKLQGDEGPDDQATAPWGWRAWQHEEDRDDENSATHRTEFLEAGDVFVDPARALSVLFDTPDGFGRTYLRNGYVAPSLRAPESRGLAGAVADAE